MTPEKTRAVRLAAAAEAFSEGTALVLVRELRAYLEDDSVAVVSAAAPVAAAAPDERAELLAEVERLRDELRRAKEAARGRSRRAASKAKVSPLRPPVDPRQTDLFASVHMDGGLDARTPSLSDPDLVTNQIQRSESEPDDPVANPDAPPYEALELAAKKRPDLPEAVVRFSWKRFAEEHPAHDSFAASMAHWRNWIRNEDRAKAEKRMYTAWRPPPATPSEPGVAGELVEDLEEPAPAPCSAVRALAASLGLPPLARAAPTPQDAMEALQRLDRDVPEPRSMSA